MEFRKVFDTIPEQFDRYRPRYCPALFQDLIAFAGIGLTSEKSALMTGRAFSCASALPAISPAKNLSVISFASAGRGLDSTEMTPLPPSARIGSVWSSLP